MILDNEEQRQNLLQVIKMTNINGPWEKILPIVQALGKLKVEVERAPLEGATVPIINREGE